MPFCSQCGNQVTPADLYCGKCGARQPASSSSSASSSSPPPRPMPNALQSINPKTASILCYVPWVGWIAAIVVLASDRFRHDRAVRFHAFQGLYLFVAWLIADQVMRPLLDGIAHLHIYQLIEAGLLGMAIFMMVKASHDQMYSLPLFGELAQRSMTERG
jgi:uncharacterized membrane protein